ncbi:MAG: GAF domain-containing protein [Bacteroidetes bacterium]|nr:GAF domain-containing protein [Bacteroidota bacterium]
MKENFNFLLKQIGPKQILIFVVFIIGIVFFIKSDILPIQVISGFVIRLSLFSLISDIATKYSYSVSQNTFKVSSATELKTTTIDDEHAKRTIIDNFDENQMDENFVGFQGEEGFVIINNPNSNEVMQASSQQKTDNSQKEFTINFDAVNQNSSMSFSNNDNIQILNDEPAVQNNKENDLLKNRPSDEYIKFDNIESNFENSNPDKNDLIIDIVNKENNNLDVNNTGNNIIADNIEQKNQIEQPAKAGAIDTIFNQLDLPNSILAEEKKEFKTSIDEFNFIVKKFLLIIKSVINANTIATVWALDDNLLLNVYITKHEGHIRQEKLPLSDNVLSRIVSSGKPEIVTNIKADSELNIIPYYTTPVGTKSFVGVPIIVQNKVIAVLSADFDEPDAYNKDVVEFLGRFTRLISILWESYDKQNNDFAAKKILELINHLSETVAEKGCTFPNICTAILDMMVQMYNFTSCGVCIYDDMTKTYRVTNYKSVEKTDERYFKTDMPIDNSLLGVVISENKNIAIINRTDVIRVNDYENQLLNGAFIAIPIKSLVDTYGALFIESHDVEILNTIDLELLVTLCNQAGEFYEKLKLIDICNNNSHIDKRTGIYNSKALSEKINEELVRCQDIGQLLTFTLISLDEYDVLKNQNKKNKIISIIMEECQNYLRPYDAIGKINDYIGIVSVGKDAAQVRHIMDNVRSRISSNPIEINGERVFITISVGISSVAKGDDFNTFTSNTTLALQHAQKRGGNTIQIFQ